MQLFFKMKSWRTHKDPIHFAKQNYSKSKKKGSLWILNHEAQQKVKVFSYNWQREIHTNEEVSWDSICYTS